MRVDLILQEGIFYLASLLQSYLHIFLYPFDVSVCIVVQGVDLVIKIKKIVTIFDLQF